MTKKQEEFIVEIMKNVEKRVLSQKLPENWDGLQLRWHLADEFHKAIIIQKGDESIRKEIKEYNEYKTTNQLW